jgi:hypothetical protein
MRKELGCIKKATFGEGGYQEAMIGIAFTIGGNSWGIGDFWGYWALDRTAHTKWAESERIESLGKMTLRIAKLLADAKKSHVGALAGTPVEVTLDGNKLHSWRVLTEVI